MTKSITIYHLRDITSDADIFVPGHEDFNYWHGDAVMNDDNSDVEVCHDGEYGRLNNLFLGDTIHMYDEDTGRYWPAHVIGKMEYYDPMIEGNKLTEPIELDLVPSHGQDDGPVISADEFAKKHGDYYEAEEHFRTWADADDPLTEITAFLERQDNDDDEYVNRYNDENRTFRVLDDIGNRIDITGLIGSHTSGHPMVLHGLADYYLNKVSEYRAEKATVQP